MICQPSERSGDGTVAAWKSPVRMRVSADASPSPAPTFTGAVSALRPAWRNAAVAFSK